MHRLARLIGATAVPFLAAGANSAKPSMATSRWLLVNDERVDVQGLQDEFRAFLGDEGVVVAEPAQPGQRLGQAVEVLRMADLLELVLDMQAVQHPPGIAEVQRRQEQIGRVEVPGEKLRVVAALAQGEHRAEGGILLDTDQRFIPEGLGMGHELHEQKARGSAVVPVGREMRQDLLAHAVMTNWMKSGSWLRSILTPPSFCLCAIAGETTLSTISGPNRASNSLIHRGGIGDEDELRRRQAEAAQNGEDLELEQGRAAVGQRLPEDFIDLLNRLGREIH